MLRKNTGLPKKPLTAFLLDHHMGMQHEGFVEATGLAGSLEAPFPASSKQIFGSSLVHLCSDGHYVPKNTTAPPSLTHLHCILLVGQT